MASVASQQQAQGHSSRASPSASETRRDGYPRDSPSQDISLPAVPPPPPTTAPSSKKGKAKKGAPDANDAARQLQAKIAQLELDQAGRTEEDAEIGAYNGIRVWIGALGVKRCQDVWNGDASRFERVISRDQKLTCHKIQTEKSKKRIGISKACFLPWIPLLARLIRSSGNTLSSWLR